MQSCEILDPEVARLLPDLAQLCGSLTIRDAVPLLPLLFLILMTISITNIYYNGIVGTGAIGVSLTLQIIAVLTYTVYAIAVMRVLHCSLHVAWCAEMVYFAVILLVSLPYMRTTRWHKVDL